VATRAQCESALRVYAEALLAFKNAVRVGWAPIGGAGEPAAGDSECAVVIYVTRKIAIDDLDPDDVLPSFLQVRDATGMYKVPTRVVEVGEAGGREAGPPAR
jgi:hypothetical protein